MTDRQQEPRRLGEQIAQLARDTVDWGKAEIDYYKAVAADRLDDVKKAAAFGIAGALIAYAAFIAMLVGLIIILMPLVGAVLAVVIVCGAALAFAALLVRAAMRHIARARRKSAPGEE